MTYLLIATKGPSDDSGDVGEEVVSEPTETDRVAVRGVEVRQGRWTRVWGRSPWKDFMDTLERPGGDER